MPFISHTRQSVMSFYLFQVSLSSDTSSQEAWRGAPSTKCLGCPHTCWVIILKICNTPCILTKGENVRNWVQNQHQFSHKNQDCYAKHTHIC